MFGAIAFSGGYIYLDNQLKTKTDLSVGQSAFEVPYYSIPENKGLLFDICGELTLIYLDFNYKNTSIAHPKINDDGTINTFGFPVDFTIEADYSLVGLIVDVVGGIDLSIDGSTFRYTGVQITDMLIFTPLADEVKYQIITEIFKGISQNGFNKEDFLLLIENSKTNLTVPDCYYWCDYAINLSSSVRIIN